MRAFVTLRQYALGFKEFAEKIAGLERKYDKKFADVYEALDLLFSEKKKQAIRENRRRIGYKI